MRRRALLTLAVGLPATAIAQARPSKPLPLLEKQASAPPPPKVGSRSATGPSAERQAAPVPNRLLESPVVIAPDDRATLEPSVIQRRLPGRGAAAEGSPSRTEERLFEPAPGARLTVPFRY